MTKSEWEKIHHYTNDRNCGSCKHSEVVEKTPWDRTWKCRKKREAGAGENVKSNYSCDLLEL